MRFWKRAAIPLLVVTLTVTGLWLTNRTVTPKTATMADVKAEAEAGGYRLIDLAGVRDLRAADPSGLGLIDTRQDWEFRSGHISGAVSFPMEPTAWSRWRKKGALEEFLGPDRERKLVFY